MSSDSQKLAIRTSCTPLTTQYDIMFDREEVAHACEWHEELNTLRAAAEGDVCNLHINTYGGSAATISAFQHIKKNSEAHFHGILEGVGYSAGSAFFLLCDTQEVGDFSEMMIHTSQGSGFYTHSQGREAHGKQVGRTSRKLVEAVYKDFLTDAEIGEVLLGKEFWLDSDEIRERLTNRTSIRNQREVDATKKEYTPEVYASQILEDIMEDCKTFDYNVIDVLKGTLELATSKVISPSEPEVVSVEDGEFPANVDALEKTPNEWFTKEDFLELVTTSDDRSLLIEIAAGKGIKFANNIGIEKLRQRILENIGED